MYVTTHEVKSVSIDVLRFNTKSGAHDFTRLNIRINGDDELELKLFINDEANVDGIIKSFRTTKVQKKEATSSYE